MKNKGLIIGIVIVLFVIIIIVAIIASRKKTDAEKMAEYQAQMLMMQQQGGQPTYQQKDSILDQIAKLSGMIAQIKGGNAPGTSSGSSSTALTWEKVPGAIGICGNPANLNKYLVLKNGSDSAEVCALQSYLNAKRGAGLVIDGKFGPLTQAALKNATGKTQASLSEVIV